MKPRNPAWNFIGWIRGKLRSYFTRFSTSYPQPKPLFSESSIARWRVAASLTIPLHIQSNRGFFFAKKSLAMKRTFHPSVVRKKRTHGFLVRMRTRGGRAVIRARRAKGRARLSV